jgi:hypothetical protein
MRTPPPPTPSRELLAQLGVSELHTGESLDNILKIFHVVHTHPDLSLFVQANPAFCCPALVTEAMAPRLEELTGVPVVTVTYDGTATGKNDAIIPYLRFPRSKREAPREQLEPTAAVGWGARRLVDLLTVRRS